MVQHFDAEAVSGLLPAEPTTDTLVDFVIPLCLTLNGDLLSLAIYGERTRLEMQVRLRSAWSRLLAYLALLIRQSTSPNVLALAFVACKILLVRGQAILNAVTGSWTVLAAACQIGLAAAAVPESSVSEQRTLSPNLSRSNSAASRAPSLSGMLAAADYCAWSFFDFLLSYKSPLLLHLRHFIREKVIEARPPASGQQSVTQQRKSTYTRPLTRSFSQRSATSRAYLTPSPPHSKSSFDAVIQPLAHYQLLDVRRTSMQPSADAHEDIKHLGLNTSVHIAQSATRPKLSSKSLLARCLKCVRSVRGAMGENVSVDVDEDEDSAAASPQSDAGWLKLFVEEEVAMLLAAST